MPDRVIPIVPVELPRLFTGTKPHFPSLIDNTMRSDFIQCERKWMYSFGYQLAPSAPSVHLHAGGAFARGLEVARKCFYQDGKTEAESLTRGLEALMQFYGPVQFPPTRSGDKSLENVIRAFDSYMSRYRLGLDPIKPYIGKDGKAMVEFGFAIPTEVMHPETGDPILYGGRSDMIGVMHGLLYVTDEKTTGSLGETWAAQWDLDSQFTGYVAAAREHGIPVAGAVVRGIGLLKTKITHAESIQQRSTWEIERWWFQLHRDLRRMVRAYNEGYWDMAISKGACASYGGCSFLMLCKSNNPEQWLNQYRKRVWDPLAKDFGEKLLENPKLKEGPSEDLEIDLKDLM